MKYLDNGSLEAFWNPKYSCAKINKVFQNSNFIFQKGMNIYATKFNL